MSLFFLFVQFEFTHAVGPHAGRYLVQPRLRGLRVGSPAGAEQIDLESLASRAERAEQLARAAAAEPLDDRQVR